MRGIYDLKLQFKTRDYDRYIPDLLVFFSVQDRS